MTASSLDFSIPPEVAAHPSDRSLLNSFRKGNQDAATRLYLRYARKLQNLAKGKCASELGRRVEPEDIVQSVFRSFFRVAADGVYDIPQGEDLWKLLMVIALNKIRNEVSYHRAAKRDIRATANLDSQFVEPGPPLSGDHQDNQHLRLVVQETLERLPEQQRKLVELRLAGHDVAEMMVETGRSRRTIERNLQEARKQIKKLLHEE